MKINFKKLSLPLLSVLLVGCASTYNNKYAATHPEEQVQPRQQYSQHSMQTGRNETITGRVTEAGGLISQNGTPYRLNGAKAAGLRDYTNQTVTVEGISSEYKGDRAIIVQSFQAEQPTQNAQAEQGQNLSRDTDKNQQANMNNQAQQNMNAPQNNQEMKRDTDQPQKNSNASQSNQGMKRDTDSSDMGK